MAVPALKSNLFGISFSHDRLDQLANSFVAMPTPGQGTRMVVTANVDHVVLLRRDRGLRDAYRNSWRRTLDGTPVWLFAVLRGDRTAKRVTGADLFAKVMTLLQPGKHRVFFVSATEAIGERLVDWLVEQGFNRDEVAFLTPPFGFEQDEHYGKTLSHLIRDHQTTHLFFGVGCPRSESWINTHRNQLGDVYAMAVGAALGFFSGVERRAPEFMRNIGAEWLWRMVREPRRLGPRYAVRSWGFVAAVANDLAGRTKGI